MRFEEISIDPAWLPQREVRRPRLGERKRWSNIAELRVLCLFVCLFVCFWLCCVACGILVPWPGIEPGPQQWKHRVLTTGPPGNSQGSSVLRALPWPSAQCLWFIARPAFYWSLTSLLSWEALEQSSQAHSLCSQAACVQIVSLLLTSCVTLGKLLSVP